MLYLHPPQFKQNKTFVSMVNLTRTNLSASIGKIHLLRRTLKLATFVLVLSTYSLQSNINSLVTLM